MELSQRTTVVVELKAIKAPPMRNKICARAWCKPGSAAGVKLRTGDPRSNREQSLDARGRLSTNELKDAISFMQIKFTQTKHQSYFESTSIHRQKTKSRGHRVKNLARIHDNRR